MKQQNKAALKFNNDLCMSCSFEIAITDFNIIILFFILFQQKNYQCSTNQMNLLCLYKFLLKSCVHLCEPCDDCNLYFNIKILIKQMKPCSEYLSNLYKSFQVYRLSIQLNFFVCVYFMFVVCSLNTINTVCSQLYNTSCRLTFSSNNSEWQHIHFLPMIHK